MKNLLFYMSALLLLCLAGCSNDADDEQSYSDIVGTWELVAYCVPCFDDEVFELPEAERDFFMFGSDQKVKVTIKKWKNRYFPLFPNEDGVYDYSYNKGKQKIQFFGIERDCIISDDEMRMEGNHSDHDGVEVDWYIFKKRLYN